ncbi:MAG: hypothetical protein ACREP8_14940 [Candidatus Binatia bacterium]
MSNFETHDFDFNKETIVSKGKVIKKTRIHLATEDFFVIGGLLVAILLVLGMLFGLIPINKLTIGAIGVSGIAAGAAKMMKSRSKKKGKG